MRLAILGTRGIPNLYGGFEQFAQYLSDGLTQKGHEVYVYNSHTHPFQKKKWRGVNIVHCFDPENQIGTVGQFIYDLNCILDCRKKNVDVVLQLGYTSSSIWSCFFPKNAVIITNMDGLEWKRSKYSNSVKAFLKFAEKLAVNNSDELIADSKAIQSYIKEKYHKDSVYIPYGANVFDKTNEKVLNSFSVQPFQYDLLIARLVPENNIEQILDGFSMTKVKRSFLVIGNENTTLAKKIKKKYKHDTRIKFLGYVKDIEVLNSLRYFSNLYFHGHSVGGTNPSLLEAMSSNALICAHNNVFNRAILGQDAIYFKTKFEVSKIVASTVKDEDDRRLFLNTQKITQQYTWDQIISDYEDFLLKSLKKT